MESDCSDESSIAFSRSSTSSLVSIIEDDFSFDSDHSFASEEENRDYLSGSIETSNEDLSSVDDELSEVVDEYDLAIFLFDRQISKVNFTFLEQKRTKFKHEL